MTMVCVCVCVCLQHGALQMSTKFAERTDQISQFLHSMGITERENKSAGLAAAAVLRNLQQGGDGGDVKLSVQATRDDVAVARRDELVSENVAGNSGPSMDKIVQLRLVLFFIHTNCALFCSVNDDVFDHFVSREAADIRRSLKEAEAVMSLPTRASIIKLLHIIRPVMLWTILVLWMSCNHPWMSWDQLWMSWDRLWMSWDRLWMSWDRLWMFKVLAHLIMTSAIRLGGREGGGGN